MKQQMKAIVPFILGAALVSAVPCLGADGDRPVYFPPLSATDPENVIHLVEIGEDGTTIRHARKAISGLAFAEEESDMDPPRDPGPGRARIHPVLERMIEEGDPELRVEVFVNLADDSPVPRFPEPPHGESADSRAAAEFRSASTGIAHGLIERRRRSTKTLRARLARREIRIEVVDQLWLLNGFVAHVRLGDVRELAETEPVLHVQPNVLATPSQPPDHNGAPDFPPHADVVLGRQFMGSDAYAALPGMNQGRIGLLDTGVNPHILLSSPPGGNLGANGDCVAGGFLCSTLGASDSFSTFDCRDHGTSSAAVLSGNDAFGHALRGVTDILVDSWKVWFRGPPDCAGPDGYVSAVAVHALQAGLLLGSRVFAIVLQGDEPEHGVLSSASNAAFHAGAVVIAANGNCATSSLCDQRDGLPQAGTVRAPANAHAVIGVGDFNVVDLETRPYQSRGPTADGRIKPDLQAPTDVRTAGAESNTQLKERYGGTSAATAFATGAAALMRNWLAKFDTFDPGQTYSRLILSGDRTWTPDDYSNVHGAGHLRLPELVCRTAYWGKVTLYPRRLSRGARRVIQVVNIPLEVKPGHHEIVAALWWPGSPWQAHNNIDLRLLDPNGMVQAAGLSVHSVFERVHLKAGEGSPMASGTWTVQVRGTHLPSPPQTIYWTADLRGCVRAEPLPPDPGPPPPIR